MEDELFHPAPLYKLQGKLGLLKPGEPRSARRGLLAMLVGWVPLAILVSGWGTATQLTSFLHDAGVHVRLLVAAPVLIAADSLCAPYLAAVARHFLDAGLVDESDRPRFQAAIASTRALLHSWWSELTVLGLAYAATLGLIYGAPAQRMPTWHASAESLHGFSAAGWWHALVGVPILLTLLIGWALRLLLWGRFLWLMARLNLALVPAHPDRAAGLMFLSLALRAKAPLAFALGAIVAGTVANDLRATGVDDINDLVAHSHMLLGVAVCSIALLSWPLLIFMPVLRKERRRGTFAYGALANNVGRQLEKKWLAPRPLDARVLDASALDVPDFSTATDLFQLAANVHQMRAVPIDTRSVAFIAISAVLPFVPVVLANVPLDVALKKITDLLF